MLLVFFCNIRIRAEPCLFHLIQRTGCFQACMVERKRFMWMWLVWRTRRGQLVGVGEGSTFLCSLQKHKGQSNASSGVIAKTANLAPIPLRRSLSFQNMSWNFPKVPKLALPGLSFLYVNRLSGFSHYKRSSKALEAAFGLCSKRHAAYRHQPPDEVIRVGVFILGA